MIFDTHSHYDDEAFDKDREDLLTGLASKGVGTVVSVGADICTSQAALALASKYENVYAAIGVHPTETGDLSEKDMDWLRCHSQDEKVVALGEIGLDYYWKEPEPEIQKYWFIRQLELAREIKLPIIVHSRDAARDTLDIIKAERAEEIGGVIHCFSYGMELTREYLQMGFYLGIGGVITFRNAKKLKEVVKYAPLDQLVLETDCPYLSPEPNRGKRNSSLNLPYVAEQIGKIKGIPADEVIAITSRNAEKLFF